MYFCVNEVNLLKNSQHSEVKMSGISGSSKAPTMASLGDVSALLQTAKKYEELNVIGTGNFTVTTYL